MSFLLFYKITKEYKHDFDPRKHQERVSVLRFGTRKAQDITNSHQGHDHPRQQQKTGEFNDKYLR
ncbi:hypothetical protein Hanom_Chr04g00351871 [Helianthus anomalus]